MANPRPAADAAAWHAALRERVAASILPGESVLGGKALDQATAFLLEAAAVREDGKPAILIRTASDDGADEAAAGQRRISRVAVINRDMPFLVDSVSHTMAAHGLTVDLLVHPIIPVRRHADRTLAGIPAGDSVGEKLEASFTWKPTGSTHASAARWRPASPAPWPTCAPQCTTGPPCAPALPRTPTLWPMPKARHCCAGWAAAC